MAVQRNVVVRIGADISSLQQGLRSASDSIGKFGDTMKSVGTKLTASITLPIVGIGAAAIKTGMDFEAAMSNIKALGGTTGKQMTELQNLAMQMGAKTKFSALEAANGIEELMKAGLTAEQVLGGGLEGALSLAAAGDIELAEAAGIASTALNAFKNDGLSVSQSADILAGAANASATDIAELNMGLSQLSAVASGIRMSFKDTNTALAVFAQNGLKGSDAGTSMKTMLLNLQPTTDKATEQFQKFGLINEKGQNIFFTTEGRLKSLSEVAGILRKQLGKLNDAQRMQTLQMMFGTDAIRAANILYGAGSEGINTMQTAMSNVTAQETATEKTNNLKGSIENLKGSIETAMITLFMLNSGPLKTLVDKITEAVNAFTVLSPSTQQWIIILAGLVAAIGPASIVIGTLASGLRTLITIFAAVATTAGLIATVIGAAVAALIYLGLTNETVRNNLVTAWNAIKSTAETVWNGITTFWTTWGPIAMSTLNTIWTTLQPITQTAFDIIKGIVVGIFDGLKTFWITWGPEITTTLSTIWNGLQPVAQTAFDMLKIIITTVFDGLKTFWNTWGEDIKVAFGIIWSGVKTVFDTGMGLLLPAIQWVFQEIKIFWEKWGPEISATFGRIFEAWMIIWNTAMNVLFTAIKEIYAAIKLFWSTWGDEISLFFSIWFDTLKGVFQVGWDGVKVVIDTVLGLITGAIKLFTDALKGDWKKVWDDIKEIATTITDGISGAFNTVVLYWGTIFTGASKTIKAIFDELWELISPIIDKIKQGIDGVKNAINTVKDTVSNITGGAFTAIASVTSKIIPHAEGGVFTKPTLLGNHLFGEAGPEAIVPLDRFEQNGQPTTNIIQVVLDGKVVQEYVDKGFGKSLVGLGVL